MRPNWFTIQSVAGQPKAHQIFIYGQIGKGWFDEDGIDAKEFAEALATIPLDHDIRVHINSPGGQVYGGAAIGSHLAERGKKAVAVVDGVAASIASIIAISCSRVEMPRNARMMIHDVSGLIGGNAEELRKVADKLDQHSDFLAGIYAEKTGKSREKMRAMMRAETWFTGEEAVAIGLADVLTGEVKLAACADFNFSAFRCTPKELSAPPTPTPATHPPPPQAGQTTGNKVQKDIILALLKEHGKGLEPTATEDQILVALKDLVTTGKVTQEKADELKKPKENIIINAVEFRKMEARLKEEKELRIKQEFRTLAMDRPYLDEKEWLPKLFNDETLLETIRSMPILAGDPNPLRTRPNVENLGNELIEKYRAMSPGKERHEFHLKHWQALDDAHASQHIQAMATLPVQEQLKRLHDPRNAATNTYGASLVTDFLADAFITTIGTRLAPLAAFSRNFGTDRMKPRATVQVPKATVASTTLTDATDFEQYDSTTTNVAITVNQYTQPFAVTNDELNKGHRLMTVAAKNAQAFANAISDIWTAKVTTANFGTAISIGSAANFDTADLGPILEAAKNYGSKNLILDGGHWAYLLPQTRENFSFAEQANGAFGFDRIAMQNRWTGATSNTVGFVCDPNAIAVGAGLPLDLPSGEFIELGTVTVVDLDLTAQVCHWFSRKARTHFMSYDVMFGAAAGDTTAGELLAST